MEGSTKEIVCHFKHHTVLFHLSGEVDLEKTAPSFGRAGNSGSPLNDWS